MNGGPEAMYIIAKALGELNEQAIFVGGATLPFYLSSENEARPTEDVDVVLNIIPKVNFHKREDILRAKGFTNTIGMHIPLCRWNYGSITVDFVPPESDESGPTNRWYKEGIKHVYKVKIKDVSVYILNRPFFIATKIEAYLGRGRNDPILSHDIEDIISVIEAADVKTLSAEIKESPRNLTNYLSKFFSEIILHPEFTVAIQGACADKLDQSSSTKEVLSVIQEIIIIP